MNNSIKVWLVLGLSTPMLIIGILMAVAGISTLNGYQGFAGLVMAVMGLRIMSKLK